MPLLHLNEKSYTSHWYSYDGSYVPMTLAPTKIWCCSENIAFCFIYYFLNSSFICLTMATRKNLLSDASLDAWCFFKSNSSEQQLYKDTDEKPAGDVSDASPNCI